MPFSDLQEMLTSVLRLSITCGDYLEVQDLCMQVTCAEPLGMFHQFSVGWEGSYWAAVPHMAVLPELARELML